MISIDREMLWQWDRGQRVQLHDVSVGTAVHFSNAAIKPNALVTEAYEDGEGVYANIPDILLQTAGTLTAYIYLEDGDEGHTEYRKMFIVRDREKPDDYVYTEDDVKTWVSLEERIKVLEESGGGAAGGLIRPLSEIGEIDGVKVVHVPDKDRVELTVEMTADSMNSVFGGNVVYKNDFLNARQLQLMFRIPGAGRLYLWELFEDDLITVTNYPNKKFIMVSTNRMIVSFTYDENGQFVSETKTYQANVQQLDEAKATIPNSATVNEDNELVMQRADGDAVSELFKVRLPQGGGTSDIPDTLPNPHPLTFTGAVEATYDGSTPVTVEIPMGGSGGGGGGEWKLIADVELTERVAAITHKLDKPLKEIIILLYSKTVLDNGDTKTGTAPANLEFRLSGNQFKPFYILNNFSNYDKFVWTKWKCGCYGGVFDGTASYMVGSSSGPSFGETFNANQEPNALFLDDITEFKIVSVWNFVANVGNVGRFEVGTRYMVYGVEA